MVVSGGRQPRRNFRDHLRFVVDQDVVIGREGAGQLVEVLFLVRVDVRVAVDRSGEPAPDDLGGLEDRVAVGEDRDACRAF